MSGQQIEVPIEAVVAKYQQRLADVTHENLLLGAHVETLSVTLQKYQQAYGPLPVESERQPPVEVDEPDTTSGR